MEGNRKWAKIFWRSLTYILVAVLSSAISLSLWGERYSKLSELESVIDEMFVGEYDQAEIEDAAAAAMIYALSDRWSYYMTQEEYASHQESVSNAYVGIGVTVAQREDGTGFDILTVEPGGSAVEGGIRPGDIMIEVDGQSLAQKDNTEMRAMTQGEAGTTVKIGVLRDGEKLEFTLERRKIQVKVAEGQLLDGNIGLVRIDNFNSGCSKATIDVIKSLVDQGATSLVFDVRNNPGGYVNEMVRVLDYLLPEGVVFREMDYAGNTDERHSDADCVKMPMAVLVNGDSYSAAEFFAACLQEYEWAVVVGEQTCGKGYYQYTLELSDGSAVNLSCGKYFTPGGVNLTEAGGIQLDVPLKVDDETAALIYGKLLKPQDDPQVQAAIEAMQKTGR